MRTVSQICVKRVRVEGLQRTKNDIVVEQIKDVLKATSLGEVRKRIVDQGAHAVIQSLLYQMNLF